MIDSTFFTTNRRRLQELLPGGLVVMTAYSQMQRGNDMAFMFEPEANFWYLTGISEPEWLMIMDFANNTTWLVQPDMTESQRIFDGGLEVSDAIKTSGIRKVITMSEADTLLRTLAKKHSLVCTTSQPSFADSLPFTLNPAHMKLWQKLERLFPKVQSCNKDLAQLRAIKQPIEIQAIQKAISLTQKAFDHVNTHINEYRYEYEIEADMSHIFRHTKAAYHAYDPIVAAGKNAVTLHYVKNNTKLKKGQLVLIDVGARVEGYAADITRTYAHGIATKRQIAIHGAVEHAHKEIISLLKPELPVKEYLDSVQKIMHNAIKEVGLERKDDMDALSTYFPHAISHGLGVDVHDELGRPKVFKEGMVLTVEPGIYIQSEQIGVRIEDDILITKNGHKNLSKQLPTNL